MHNSIFELHIWIMVPNLLEFVLPNIYHNTVLYCNNTIFGRICIADLILPIMKQSIYSIFELVFYTIFEFQISHQRFTTRLCLPIKNPFSILPIENPFSIQPILDVSI